MKSQVISLFALTLLSVTAAQSQVFVSEEGGTLPFKARLARNSSVTPSMGKVEYIFSVFNAASGGTKLFEERQSLQAVDGNLYAQVGSRTPGGIPAHILQNNARLWIEMEKSSSPWAAEQSRLLLVLRREAVSPNYVTVYVDPSLCYTCGGAWPYFGGYSVSNSYAYERGPGCSGGFSFNYHDSSPYLCGR
jgi:hypothetical protein